MGPNDMHTQTHTQTFRKKRNVYKIVVCCFSHSAYWLPTRKTTLHGGQSRSWSAEQGKIINNKIIVFLSNCHFHSCFPQTQGKREKPNWQNTFPTDALCAYSTVSLPVSLSSLRLATGVSLSTGVGNSSYCT